MSKAQVAKTSKIQAKYRTAEEWAKLGVKVRHTAGSLPLSERETSVNFIESEKDAGVQTCHPTWQKRLENYGAVPESIQLYENNKGECRWYIVPKTWVKPPRKPSAVKQALGKAQAAKKLQQRG